MSPGLSSKSGFTQTCPDPTREPLAQRDHREQKREGLGGSGVWSISCAAPYDQAALAQPICESRPVSCGQSTRCSWWPQRLRLHCKMGHVAKGLAGLFKLWRILRSVGDRIRDQRWTPREISLPLKGRGSNKHFSDSSLLLWNPRAKEITGSVAPDFRGARISPLLIWKQVLSATGIQTQTLVMSHTGQTFSFENR